MTQAERKSKLGYILGKASDSRVFRPDPMWVLPDTRIGVELEFEGVGGSPLGVRDDRVAYWEQHEDHSLKDRGAEFTFAEPLFGEDARKALEFIYEQANKKKWLCTTRTGIHVHMDIRDLDVGQLQAILLLYAIFEKPLFRWIGDAREESIYCLPWYKAETSLATAASLLRRAREDVDSESEGALGVAGRFHRYAALNLNAMSKFGSIEFRHLKTTLEYQRVVDFINIILCLKRGALRVPTSDGALVREVRVTGAERFGRYIFGDHLFNQLNYPEFETDVLTVGVPNASEIVRMVVNGVGGNWDNQGMVRGEPKGLAIWRNRNKKEEARKENHPEAPAPQVVAGVDPPLAGDWVARALRGRPQPIRGPAVEVAQEPRPFDPRFPPDAQPGRLAWEELMRQPVFAQQGQQLVIGDLMPGLPEEFPEEDDEHEVGLDMDDEWDDEDAEGNF